MNEMDKYLREVEEESKAFDFIKIDYLVDMREAQKRYQDEYKNNVGKIKENNIGFSDWLDMKKLEALKFSVEHHNLNI